MANDEKPKIKIKLISDIHLELRKVQPNLKGNDAHVLVLAGDIGYPHLNIYKNFIKWCSNNYPHVILITGNHEYYYSQGYYTIDQKIAEICKTFENVHFLQRSHIDLMGIRFLGCTLWSHIPEEAQATTQVLMNDYFNIKKKIMHTNGGYYRKTNITVNDTNDWHDENVQWLTDQIKYNDNEALSGHALPLVIVTHHAPSFNQTSNPTYQDAALKNAYATDLEYLMKYPQVKLWCFGHTHWYTKININDCIVWSNPIGYPIQKIKYKDDDFVEI